MKDYYAILGVKPTAHEAEIKRAYRRLAVLYHPDKNPDPSVEQFFKEVNEAYDVLSDPQKRSDYDYRCTNQTYAGTETESAEPRSRDPYFRRKQGQSVSKNNKGTSTNELMRQYLPIFIWFSWAGFLFCSILLIDYLLPRQESTEQIEGSYVVSSGRSRRYVYDVLVTVTGREVSLYGNQVSKFTNADEVILHKTVILQLVSKIENPETGYTIDSLGVFGPPGFLAIVLMVCSLLGLLFKEKVEASFNLSVVSAILLVINLYLIFAL